MITTCCVHMHNVTSILICIYMFICFVLADALGRATLCALMASNGMQSEQMFQLTI